MQHVNAFTDGLHSDNDKQLQPSNTYRRALNAIRTTDGVLTNEEGTTNILNFPDGMTVIGDCTIGDNTVLFLTNGEDSEIGVFNDSTYTKRMNTKELNFQLGSRVDAEGRIDFKGHTIVYFTDNVNPIRRIDLDDIPTTNISKKISMFLEYGLPDVKVTGIEESGSLKSGIYQFATRLLTDSMNPTPFGLITNVVPIVDESITAGRNLYDGVVPGVVTNKSIKVKVDNIDQDYTYLQIACVYYNDITNTQKVAIISTQPIQGRTSIEYTYSSDGNNKESLTIDELTQDFAHYDKAKCVEQKDGIMFFSNLSSNEPVYDFQSIANKIVMKYKIEEVVYQESVNIQRYIHNQKEGLDLGTKVTLMNDYKDPFVSQSKKSYMRDEVYSFAFVPIFKGKKFGNAYHIPAPYSNSNFNDNVLATYYSAATYPSNGNYPSEGGANTKVRHHRFPNMNKEPIIRTSGMTTYLRLMGVEASNIVIPDNLKDILEGYIIVRQRRTDENKSIISQGIAQPLYMDGNNKDYLTLSPWTGQEPYYNGFDNTRVQKSRVAFFSPESVIYQKAFGSVNNIERISDIDGDVHTCADKRTGSKDEKFAAVLNNYTMMQASTSSSSSVERMAYIPSDDESMTAFYDSGDKYNINENTGYLMLKLSSDLSRPMRKAGNGSEVFYNERDNRTDELFFHRRSGTSITEVNGDNSNFKGVSLRGLYNLKANRVDQYGQVFDAEYIVCQEVIAQLPTSLSFYGGDTFIGKFSCMASMRRMGGDQLTDFHLRAKAINYFWCETEINVNYRHQQEDTVPYYPKVNKMWTEQGDGLFQVPARLGHNRGYNKQYSFENTIRAFFPRMLGQVNVTDFGNRTIYSEMAIEGEQYDANRVFLANNYHDIPRDRGSIVDTFVFANSLYLHTSQSLFKSYVNERTTQATSSGDVVLGNGGLFPIPSQEVMTVNGGYAGTESMCGINTPFGRIFVDNRQRKIFMFDGQLNEISDKGMSDYFMNCIERGDKYRATYDYKHQRYIISGLKDLHPTLTYSPYTKNWVSYHSYNPTYMFYHGVDTFVINNSQLCKLGGGEYGKYFDEYVHPFELDLIVNPEPHLVKVYDNIQLQSSHPFTSIECDNDEQYSGVMSIAVDNSLDYELSYYQLLCRYKNSQWQLSYPRGLDDDDIPSARLKSKYLTCKYTFSNEPNEKFKVKYINSKLRSNAR